MKLPELLEMIPENDFKNRLQLGVACKQCKDNEGKFYPDHNPSKYCQSGKKPHCTCDICF